MRHQPFQFSLRGVFAFVAFLCVALGLWVSPATWYVGLAQLLLVVALPAFAVVCAVCFTGRARAASIGIAVATLLPAVSHILEFIQTSRVVVSEDGRPVRIEPDFFWGLQGSAGWFSDVLLLWALAPVVAGACAGLHTFLLTTDSNRMQCRDGDGCAPSNDFATRDPHRASSEPAG